jgi:Esterase-like activity of phytase/Bacterial Ig domain
MNTRLHSLSLLLLGTAITAGAATVPLAVNDNVVVPVNTEQTINVLANDIAATGPLSVIAASAPAHGKVVLQNGKVRYIPTAAYVGSDSFTYTIRDALSIGAVDRSPLAAFGSGASAATVFASGFGSALAKVPGSANDYYIMTDRGPNSGGTGTNKVFPVPSFAPQIARVTPNATGGYRVVSTITFKRPVGAPAYSVNGTAVTTLTGLPNTFNPTAGIAVSVGGAAITPGTDDFGLDSEGLVALADGTFWVSDEYGPYICHFDATGVELERIAPSSLNISSLVDHSTHALPAVLKKRFENKGMEGLTITPDGTKLVGIMQSPLDNLLFVSGTADVKKGVANRIVVYDLATGVTQQYVYLLERTGSGTPNTTVSEISAITNRKFLVDERDSKFPNDPVGGASTIKRFYVLQRNQDAGRSDLQHHYRRRIERAHHCRCSAGGQASGARPEQPRYRQRLPTRQGRGPHRPEHHHRSSLWHGCCTHRHLE